MTKKPVASIVKIFYTLELAKKQDEYIQTFPENRSLFLSENAEDRLIH